MKNFKITRTAVVIALILFGIALTFLNFWLFNETKIFNDVFVKDSYHSYVSYGWIHMAINALVIIFDIVYLIYAIWEFSNDNPPFKSLYNKDEYNHRRRRDEEEKEPKESKPIRWKRWIWFTIILIFLVQVFKLGKTIYNQSVFMYNTSKIYHNTYQQKIEEKLGFYDKLWKTYLQKEKITNVNKDVFIQATKLIMENRADGEKLTWKWLQENQPIDYNIFSKFYADLSIFIAEQREGYFSIEKACQLIANKNNTMLDTFPNNFYNKALKIQRINFEYGFLSDSTNNVFRTKIENLQ
ncbi:MAG: hypothetical protein WC428_02380 [Candidatus Paceibacterota bacterium]